jgi:secretion/DNA translocation related TadE-like protein
VTRRGRTGERGSASIWLLGIGLAVVLFGLGMAGVGVALVARHRAQVAADLGALAGAPLIYLGPDPACARAAELVTANGGRLITCDAELMDLVVSVGVDTRFGTAHAAARAGPARASPGAGPGSLRE